MIDLISASDLAKSGIAVIIGVSMVFFVLASLILVVLFLRCINNIMNKWDEHMLYARQCKNEKKSIKKSNCERFAARKIAIKHDLAEGKIDTTQVAEQMIALKADKILAKADYHKAKININIKYDTVFNLIKESNFMIRRKVRAEAKQFAEAKKNLVGSDRKKLSNTLKDQRMIARAELNQQVKEMKEECVSRIEMTKAGIPIAANQQFISYNNEVNDSHITAVIAATIAVMLSASSSVAPNKAGFRVRSIKEIK